MNTYIKMLAFLGAYCIATQSTAFQDSFLQSYTQQQSHLQRICRNVEKHPYLTALAIICVTSLFGEIRGYHAQNPSLLVGLLQWWGAGFFLYQLVAGTSKDNEIPGHNVHLKNECISEGQ